MATLKRVLFDTYDGFADKRVKKLENATTFIVDDRGVGGVIGADKKPLSWFCHIYADALSDDELLVRLWNMPSSKKIDKWLEKNEAKRKNVQGVGIMINRGKQGLLTELSLMMRAIVAPGARYEVNYFKYSCPRVAKSLDKLKAALDVAWTPGSKGGAKAGPPLFADED